MNETQNEVPLMTTDQKLKIVLAHRAFIKAEHDQILSMKNLQFVAELIARDLNIDHTMYELNLDTLEFVKRK